MKLTQETLIPIGLAATVVAGVAILSWRISASYVAIETRLEQIEKKLNDGAAQNVSERDLRLWMMTLRDKNKALDIPEWFR